MQKRSDPILARRAGGRNYGLDTFVNLADHLVRAARVVPHRTAVQLGDSPITDFQRLAAQVASLAQGMRTHLALPRGARVAIAMSNSPACLLCLYACWHAGLIAVPINAKLHPREMAYIVDHAGASLIFSSPDLHAAVSDALTFLGPQHAETIDTSSADFRRLLDTDGMAADRSTADEAAWIFYTSGTTGRPKGAVLTHGNLIAMAFNYLAEVDAVAPGDAFLHAAPMSHGSGLYCVPHMLAMATQIVPESGRFDADEILRIVSSRNGISLFAAPTMVQRLTSATARYDSAWHGLKTIVYGGGPMYVADCKAALNAFGPKLTQIYGQGESPMTITLLPKHLHLDDGKPDYERRLASVGFAQAAVEVRTVGVEGHDVEPNAVGEVLVRGSTVMSEYWQNPTATASALKDGWLHTGDLGSFDERGFLTLLDRSKDVIISGGTNIYPREVEEVLLMHPDVIEASVIGRPHLDWGEEVVAMLVLRPHTCPRAAQLDQLCGDWIARFKRPKAYFVLDGLPKNHYGKVLKTELRTLFDNKRTPILHLQ